MKKNSIIIGLFIIASLLCTACKLEVKPEKTLHRPDVEPQAGAMVITGTYDSTAIEYINVYRVDKTADTKAINIGVIFPSGFNTENKTYSFFDKTAFEGSEYSYYCRIYEGKYGYYTTEESEKVEVPTGYGLDPSTYSTGTDDDLKCNIGSTFFQYDNTTKVISFDTAISTKIQPAYAQADYNEYCLIIKCQDSIQSFLLSETGGNFKAGADNKWNLQILLPSTFFNKDIQVLGIIAQKKETVDGTADTPIKRLYWTNLAPIEVKDTSATPVSFPNNTFQLTIESGSNGNDYGYVE